MLWRWCLVAMVAAGVAGCGSLAPPASGGEMLAPARIATSSSGPHLYVADGDTIYRFALVNGLPQQSPESVFATGPAVEFLGVDRAGAIYAAGSDGFGSALIEKYDSGGKLLGTATLNFDINAFAVDGDGYMYASPGYGASYAYVYSSSAFDESEAEPVATLLANESFGFEKMGVGDRGRLYAAAYQNVNVFDHPHKTAAKPNQQFAAPGGSDLPVFDEAIAFDQHNRFYGALGHQSYCSDCRFYLYMDFDAVSHPLGPNRKDHIVYGNGCRSYGTSGGYAPGYITGMAVYGGYIDAACTGITTAVYVFRADHFRHQKPVETLSGLVVPTDAKIGP